MHDTFRMNQPAESTRRHAKVFVARRTADRSSSDIMSSQIDELVVLQCVAVVLASDPGHAVPTLHLSRPISGSAARKRFSTVARLAVLVLSIAGAGCASTGADETLVGPLDAVIDGTMAEAVDSGEPDATPTPSDVSAGPTVGLVEGPPKLSAMLVADMGSLGQTAAGVQTSGGELDAMISALQNRARVPITGRLGRSDVVLLRASLGDEVFNATILEAKMRLALAGYEVDTLDAQFDEQLVLALLQVSHDAGASPDSTLSFANLDRIDQAGPRPTCPLDNSPIEFALDGAQAIVDHLDQMTPPPPILLLDSAPITGDVDLDQRLIDRAQQRGYQLRPEATALAPVDSDAMLGIEAAPAWMAMREAASLEGVSMFAASGHRSRELQRLIFVDRLQAIAGTPLESWAVTDEAVDAVLDSHAPPGFSKHQTGNAIDIGVPNVTLVDFASTEAFQWLSQDNFANARRFGFVPSYPAGVDGLGPQPEAWEWLWVGVDVLYRCPPGIAK